MAQLSTLPSSMAPFSLSISTYSFLQYMPATSKGVCPRLVGLLSMGSPCFKVDRYSGMKGELCEHICTNADDPDESICECNLSLRSRKGTYLPYTFSYSRYTCLTRLF